MSLSWVEAGDLIQKKGGSINPAKYPDVLFELYSVPSHESRVPELRYGSEIGSSKQLIREGDVLLCKIVPHIRRSWVVGKEHQGRLIGSGEWIIFRGNSFWPDYLKHLLVSDWFHARLMQTVSGVGGSLLRARPAEVAKIKLPLPPLPEQKRIAAILDQADALREKRWTAIARLDELLQSVFLDMFGDPMTNPKSKLVELNSVCTRITDGTHLPPEWSPNGIPFLFVSNIRNCSIDFQTSKFISEREYNRLTKNCPIEQGDVLYTVVGSYGNPALVRTDRKFAFQRHVAHIKPSKEIHPEYLETMLDSIGVRRQADRVVTGVAQKTLILRELRKLTILLPSMELQEDFAMRKEEVLSIKHKAFRSLADSDALFSSLQQRAFRGEL